MVVVTMERPQAVPHGGAAAMEVTKSHPSSPDKNQRKRKRAEPQPAAGDGDAGRGPRPGGGKANKHLAGTEQGAVLAAEGSTRRKRRKKVKSKEFNMQEPQKTPQLRFCFELLLRLINHKFSAPFRAPVDPVALGLDDYFDVIDEPMDLGSIRTKISNLGYSHESSFIRDVRLVFSNCIRYNSLNSDVGFMAQELSNLFEDQLARMPCRKSGNRYVPKVVTARKGGAAAGPTPRLPDRLDPALRTIDSSKLRIGDTLYYSEFGKNLMTFSRRGLLFFFKS